MRNEDSYDVMMCLKGGTKMTESKDHQVSGVKVYGDECFVLECSCGSYFIKIKHCVHCGKKLVNGECKGYHPRMEY
jgi:hypothetical protein